MNKYCAKRLYELISNAVIFLFMITIITSNNAQAMQISRDSLITICKKDLKDRGINPGDYTISFRKEVLTLDSLKHLPPFHVWHFELLKKVKKYFVGKKFYEISFFFNRPVLDGMIIYYLEKNTGKILFIYSPSLPPHKSEAKDK